ncbi:MAG: FHA domain-containing protein, partial [Kiritimatiellaeota bacterium]|nr:FHA domain-containing protein [Kiritimatiellota bacterium]
MQLTYMDLDGNSVLIKVTSDPIMIGRDKATAKVLIKDGKVSRNHCSVWLQGSECWIKDLNSSNGTWVNGARIGQVKLQAGDEISVGPILLTCVTGKQPGMKTVFLQTEQEMSEGKGYSTILRKI